MSLAAALALVWACRQSPPFDEAAVNAELLLDQDPESFLSMARKLRGFVEHLAASTNIPLENPRLYGSGT